MIQALRQEFEAPGSAYRGKPFWAWNGRLEEAELRRQIRVMAAMGLGGFFMHSRVGLATPYLSDEWFYLVEACCDEAERCGMEAWLYDEDRWPSGAGGGLVTRDPRHRMRRLQLDVVDPAAFSWAEDHGLLRVFTARLEGSIAQDVAPLPRGAAPPEGVQVLAFRVLTAPQSDWYNGQTYLDTLSHEAVQRFIAVTHEAYREQVGDRFGKSIPGIFTDEPNMGGTCEEYLQGVTEDRPPRQIVQAPWTERLPEVFRERYGYDLLDHLPALFFDVDGEPVHQARHHYHDCRTHLFVDAFARQIGEWCETNGLMHTGHVLYESPLSRQVSVVGSCMRFYEHMQAPGIDILSEHSPEYDTAKQCASVQRQLGRRWVLSELYGCTGWDFPFEGHKAVGDWQAALGVNVRCQHLAWYVMEGEAKRDYPASISYQSPWWEHYRAVEDYFARVGSVMSRGSAVRRLLVVHPNESMWQAVKVGWPNAPATRQLEKQLVDLRTWLLEAHIDFDYGDEVLLSRLGGVRDADGKAEIVVGRASYDVLLVPPLVTVRASTLALARGFLAAGGVVVFAGTPPHFVDALEDPAAGALAREAVRVPFSRAAVVGSVESARVLSIRNVKGLEEPSLLFLHHREDGHQYLFVCNTDRRKGRADITISLPQPEDAPLPEEWDPETGRVYQAQARREGMYARIRTQFAPSGSRLFVFPAAPSGELGPRVSLTAEREAVPLKGRWAYTLGEPNVLVLDRARFRIGNGDWQAAQEVLRVDRAVRQACGLRPRGAGMVQPWARDPHRKPAAATPLELAFDFQVDHLPASAVELAIERPGRCRIALNGTCVSADADCGWWTDRSLRRLPLPAGALREGANVLTVALDYGEDDGIEAAFLLGSFGVSVEGAAARLAKLPPMLRVGDWCCQGLPFYSGSVVYRRGIDLNPRDGERAILEVPRFAGACVRVLAGGDVLRTMGWPPYEVDLTDAVRDGRIDLGIEVCSHRRNAFGPLHHTESRPPWVGSGEFMTQGDKWQDDYNLVPCGLLKTPVIRYRS